MKPDEEVAKDLEILNKGIELGKKIKEQKPTWINIKNILGRKINICGQALEPEQTMRVNDCNEVRNILREKWIEIVGQG